MQPSTLFLMPQLVPPAVQYNVLQSNTTISATQYIISHATTGVTCSTIQCITIHDHNWCNPVYYNIIPQLVPPAVQYNVLIKYHNKFNPVQPSALQSPTTTGAAFIE